jgi:hypothetical protein
MKKAFLTAIIISLFVIISPAFAEMHSADGTIVINIPTISSGGSAGMEGGGYRMMDLKGQGVIS